METESDLTGSILAGRYSILKRLGVGAMGAVYLGEHLKIGRKDAIKVLRDGLATDREAIARFNRGARNVAAIRHPNICTIYDYSDTDDGLQFVAMEFVPGETLGDLLQREGRLPLARAVQITLQVAAALQAAHDMGIVHRDLKPANIMISAARHGADEIKVVDFDIAKGPGEALGEEVTRLGFVVGTPEYMSPEQLIGERLDGRSDVYSLALVLFRMIAGVLPFQGEAQDVMVKRLTDDPMPLSDAVPDLAFPAELDAVIRRALRRRSGERHESAEEFAAEVVRSVEGRLAVAPAAPARTESVPILERTPPSVEREVPLTAVHGSQASAPPPRNRRMILAALGAGGVLLAAVLAVILIPNRGEPPADPLVVQSALTDTGDPVDPLTDDGVPVIEELSASDSSGSSQEVAEQTEGPTPSPPPVSDSETVILGGGLNDASASALLVRLLDRLGPPEPAPVVLRAIRDSAQSVDQWPGASNSQRARSAYVMASALLSLGDTLQAVELLERAVAMEPNNRGYNTLLNALPAEFRGRVR
ncbi:MAG TPA: serine/threonine-protein kinase [Longimicrobiaceae bacterium]|nr:serine/threonine-protein kinase [Longimicrobiaceae bacterium]